ncbi:MAG: LytR C-terminal domain-containing protein [Thermodesulfobacteriota bacterium]
MIILDESRLKLSGTLQKDGGKVFTNDFMLRYFHTDGKEDRTECRAIARAETSEIGEFDSFVYGNGAWVRLDSGKVYFGLAFLIEKDVDTIDIHRMGVDVPLTYRIGTDRLYSVAIYTNKDSNILSEAAEIIKAGGYQVVTTSETLAKEETGTTILYREQAESQAREISQRLMTKLGIVPTVKKMDVISDVDIVVWLGK